MTREKIVEYFGETWVDFITPFMQDEEQWGKINKEVVRMVKAKEAFAPGVKELFRAFKETPLDSVRVVILGQEPYPIAGYANGLAFGHPKQVKTAASLATIIDAVEVDCYNGLQFDKANFDTPMLAWAHQGILMLNTALTVPLPKEGQKAGDVVGAHEELWRPFTNYIISKLQEVKHNVIYLAWGAKAQDATKDINPFFNFVFGFEHPAAAARRKEPWKCKHFSTVNATIVANKMGDKIIW